MRPYHGESRDEWEHVTCPEDVPNLLLVEDEPPPFWCPACSDCTIDPSERVCETCRQSTEDDWLRPEYYEAMRRLAGFSDAIVREMR